MTPEALCHGVAAKDSLAIQRITTDAGDAWPACSPKGDQLVYQNVYMGISELPTVDCIPVANAARSIRYLVGYIPAWRPTWSPDGRAVAFSSSVNASASSVYTAVVADFAPQRSGAPTRRIARPRPPGAPGNEPSQHQTGMRD